MITHFEAVVALLSGVLGLLAALVTAVWKARGWIDRLNTTDGNLAKAIETLTSTQSDMHAANQRRFQTIEDQLQGWPPAHVRPNRGSARQA